MVAIPKWIGFDILVPTLVIICINWVHFHIDIATVGSSWTNPYEYMAGLGAKVPESPGIFLNPATCQTMRYPLVN